MTAHIHKLFQSALPWWRMSTYLSHILPKFNFFIGLFFLNPTTYHYDDTLISKVQVDKVQCSDLLLNYQLSPLRAFKLQKWSKCIRSISYSLNCISTLTTGFSAKGIKTKSLMVLKNALMVPQLIIKMSVISPKWFVELSTLKALCTEFTFTANAHKNTDFFLALILQFCNYQVSWSATISLSDVITQQNISFKH